MAEYNKAFNDYLNTKSNFYLGNTSYEEYVKAKQHYTEEKQKIFGNLSIC